MRSHLFRPSWKVGWLSTLYDVESYGSERRLLGDSSDGDSDDDDKRITHGVEMPSSPEPRPMEVDAPFVASTGVGPVSAPTVDDFYNAARKAPHPDTIVPKQESGWWAACEERKRRKAQERELAALQLREVQEQAALERSLGTLVEVSPVLVLLRLHPPPLLLLRV